MTKINKWYSSGQMIGLSEFGVDDKINYDFIKQIELDVTSIKFPVAAEYPDIQPYFNDYSTSRWGTSIKCFDSIQELTDYLMHNYKRYYEYVCGAAKEEYGKKVVALNLISNSLKNKNDNQNSS